MPTPEWGGSWPTSDIICQMSFRRCTISFRYGGLYCLGRIAEGSWNGRNWMESGTNQPSNVAIFRSATLSLGNIREIIRFGLMKACLFGLLAFLAGCSNDASNSEAGSQQSMGEAAEPSPVLFPTGSEMDRRSAPKNAIDEQSRQAARKTLQGYFALVGTGRTHDAAKLWRDRSRGVIFNSRLQRFEDFELNIATPSRGDTPNGLAQVTMSLQLLRKTSSGLVSLSDGTAVLERANEDSDSWRIDHIALQPPPVPLAN